MKCVLGKGAIWCFVFNHGGTEGTKEHGGFWLEGGLREPLCTPCLRG